MLVRALFVLSIILIPFGGVGSPFKNVYLGLIAILMVVSPIYLLLPSEKFRRNSYEIAAIVCLLTFQLVGIIFNYVGKGLEVVIPTLLCLYWLSMALTVAIIFSEVDGNRAAWIVLGFVAIVIASSVDQWLTGQDRIWGNPLASGRVTGLFSWGKPVVGSYIGMAFPLLFLGVSERRWKSWTMFFFVFTYMGCILFAGNRSMLVSNTIGMVAACFVSSSIRLMTTRYIVVSTVFVFFISAALAVYLSEYLGSNVVNRVASLAGDIIEEQQTKRIATWLQTICAISDRVVLGYGAGNYEQVLSDYLTCAPVSEGIMPHPHSFYLEYIFVFGLPIFVAMMSIVMWLMLRSLVVSDERWRVFIVIVAVNVLSPLNVTHGLASTWWLNITSFMLGLSLSRAFKYVPEKDVSTVKA